MVKLTIDGKSVKVPKDTSVLAAARSAGITIPTLCYHPRLKPFGGCRLCVVEIKSIPRLVSSCTTPVAEDMEVQTNTERLQEVRATIMKLLLSDHPVECINCRATDKCALHELTMFLGVSENEFTGERRKYDTRDGNPFIERNMEKCIMCGRCVRVCDEIQGANAIDFAYRGFKSKVTPPFEKDLDCEFCGQCVQVCPTGALLGKGWDKGLRLGQEKHEVDTVCAFCGTGCNITLHVQGRNITKVTSSERHWNEGWLCVKGRFGYKFVESEDRLKKPMVRKDGELVEVSWEEALDYTADKLKAIKKESGPDAIGGLCSARCTNEENYLFQKLMRGAIGTNNVDHCARL
jgi:predicted molibdopterin-dependent oxidoreductase YjgC